MEWSNQLLPVLGICEPKDPRESFVSSANQKFQNFTVAKGAKVPVHWYEGILYIGPIKENKKLKKV